MSDPQSERAIAAARQVLADHMSALNARDRDAIAATLHFPHYRLAGGELKVWETPDSYFDDFLARAGTGWNHSQWDRQDVIAASEEKVHFAMTFTRFRADGSEIGRFQSIWVVACIDGRWAAQLRSSFAK